MRPFIIAGNWKMNTTLSEAEVLVRGIRRGLDGVSTDRVRVIVCPPFISLYNVHKIIRDSSIALGAQNLHEHDSGAYTGEISAAMLRSTGCEYVIIGHSERRKYFHETDDMVNAKIKKAVENGLRPIVCVGELLEERERGATVDIVSRQVHGAFDGLEADHIQKCIIAYEPVWAIGTGKTATPQQAQEVHEVIRGLVREAAGSEIADQFVIQYGGSMKPENAGDLLSQPDVDGGLIGGASLKADSFITIVQAAESIGRNR